MTLVTRPLSAIARDIHAKWLTITPYAKAYSVPMLSLNSITEMYGDDSAESIVLYFLSNAQSWRGPDAKAIKDELKSILSAHKALKGR